MAPELTSEAWAQIRYDYEHTDRPVEDICAEHGISSGTLRDRMRRWNWTRRRLPIPPDGPPAVAAPQAEQITGFATLTPALPLSGGASSEAVGEGGRAGNETSCVATIDPHPIPPLSKGRECAVAASDPASIAPRLQSAVARVLPAIEATLAKLAAGPQRPREMEQTARTLGALMRTLRELNALLSQHPLRSPDDYDDMPEDMDAFREALARRIEAFVKSRKDDEDAFTEARGDAEIGRP